MKPEKKASMGDILVIGFAMFAMFFGAGNLIFPPYLGMVGGDQWFTGFLAFIIADGGLAVLTVLAMIRKDGSFWCVIDRIGDLPAKILASVAILTVGPMLCIPRTCATTFEMGIVPLFPGFNTWVFSIIFFGIVYMLTIRPSAVVDIIGKFLTPLLLVVLAVLVVIGIINPIGEIADVTLVDSIAKEGILAGYQTMDVLVSLAVTLMLVGNAARKGYNSKKERMGVISRASAVALLGLSLVYGGLTYLGATTSLLGPAGQGRYRSSVGHRILCLPDHSHRPGLGCGRLFLGTVQRPRQVRPAGCADLHLCRCYRQCRYQHDHCAGFAGSEYHLSRSAHSDHPVFLR